MAERLNRSETPYSVSLLTVAVGELIREQPEPFNPSSPGYLYENIRDSGNFGEVFKALDEYIGTSLSGCRCEQLVAAVAASESCPEAATAAEGAEKQLCRYLEDTLEPAQSVAVTLGSGGEPVRAVIEFNQTVFNSLTAAVDISYGPNRKPVIKTSRLNIPAGEGQKQLSVSLTEERGAGCFIRRVGIEVPGTGENAGRTEELRLERKLSLIAGKKTGTEVTRLVTKITRDGPAGEIVAEESKPA